MRIEAGDPPGWYVDRPPTDDAVTWWITTYWELGTARTYTAAGPAEIPWDTVEDYMDRFGIPDRERFRRVIRRLDSVFLGWVRDRAGGDAEAAAASTPTDARDIAAHLPSSPLPAGIIPE